MDLTTLASAVLAIGALGTASFGLVDGTKLFRRGMSNQGFNFIEYRIFEVLGIKGVPAKDSLGDSIKDTLYANWINGVELADQKSKAKSLLLLALTPEAGGAFAGSHGLDARAVTAILDQMAEAESLDPKQKDVWGRFDLILTSLLDEAYQHADQYYRNSCKLVATILAVILSLWGMATLQHPPNLWPLKAILAGLLSGPLAPIAKDLASSLTAGVKAAQSLGS